VPALVYFHQKYQGRDHSMKNLFQQYTCIQERYTAEIWDLGHIYFVREASDIVSVVVSLYTVP
jgi:hypothetical protein